jgi:hypothetical protein
MADEAFALSPISARAALPSEQDYDAIREAFMETSRGRWFLGEYAKRNRNADTTMVLDAVVRLEETLAAQKKPVRDPLFDEALAALRGAIEEAREAAKAALGDLALEENLAPVRKGARVIREIAWRLREIGADGRICDLIDSQVGAIEGAAGKLAPVDLAGALSEAFDGIAAKIAAFDAHEATASSPPPAETSPAETSPAEASPAETSPSEETVETAGAAQAAGTEAPDAAIASETAATVDADTASEPADVFDANDEALLDMVAMEMGAPDTDEAYEPPADEECESETSYEIDVTYRTDAGDAPEAPVIATALPAVTPLQPAPEPALKSAPEPSLGSSLLANGIVSRPRTSKPDPLAPIRRMSQTEKIAFFS